MKIPYILLDRSGEVKSIDSQWDMTLVRDLFENRMWQLAQGHTFIEQGYSEALAERHHYGNPGAIIIVPARQNAGKEEEINDYINAFNWCIVMLMGDEERDFDYKKLKHPKMKLWLMQPTMEDEADFYLGSGYAPATRDLLKNYYQSYIFKTLDWFFSGQNNHLRRQLATNILTTMVSREDINGEVHLTNGFTHGMEHNEYFERMASAKAVPCPSGIESPDSFRLYEALESGAVPVVDEFSGKINEPGYWQKVFGEGVPFKVLNNNDNLEGYICDVAQEYPTLSNRVFAWWIGYKRKMAQTLNRHIRELSDIPFPADSLASKITVIIPTSVIPSHPLTGVLDTTIENLRMQLPDCEIILCIDKVREEQLDNEPQYLEYIRRILWKCNFDPLYKNTLPLVFEEFSHQVKMLRKAMEYVETPTVLFVEHDTPIYGDRTFEWDNLCGAITEGNANVIRLHHEAEILPDHRHLMLDESPQFIAGAPMMRTMQWSSRPHLASTVFYKKMLNDYFSEQAITFTEDKLYGAVSEDCKINGEMGWFNWRLWIYTPEGDMKRSYTTDGRQNNPKFDDKLIF